jgi:hypothetical protein
MAKKIISTTLNFDYPEIPASPGDDLIFVISNFELDIIFSNKNKTIDEVEAWENLQHMAKEIWIDKTYVKFKGNKYKNTFLREDGWNLLLSYVWKTNKKNNIMDQIILRKAFESMILAYMDHILNLFNYDPNLIEFQINPNSYINIRILKDIAKEWKIYPGCW